MVIRDLCVFLTQARLLEECLRPKGEGLTEESFQKALNHYKTCVLAAFWLSEDVNELPEFLENTCREVKTLIASLLALIPLSAEEQVRLKAVMSRPTDSLAYRESRDQIFERVKIRLSENSEEVRTACDDWIKRADELIAELEDHYRVESFQRTVSNIYHVLKDALFIARRREFQPKTISDRDAQDISAVTSGLSLGSLAAGILYILIFIPLTFVKANSAAIVFIDAILFNFFQPHAGLLSPIKGVPDPQATVLIYSYGVLYGVTSVVLALILPTVNFFALAIKANGILWGYYLAIVFDSLTIGHFERQTILSQASFLKFAYVLLLYYCVEFITEVATRLDKYPEKYEELFSGLYGLLVGWIIAREFGEAAVVFDGVVFLVLTFFSMWFAELCLRWMAALIGVIGGGDLRTAMKAMLLFDPQKSSFGMISLRSGEARLIAVIAFLVNSVFPFLAYFLVVKWIG